MPQARERLADLFWTESEPARARAALNTAVWRINKALAGLEGIALKSGGERNKAWADVNKMIVEQAPGIPYIWDKSIMIASKNVNAIMNGYNATWDLSFTSIK